VPVSCSQVNAAFKAGANYGWGSVPSPGNPVEGSCSRVTASLGSLGRQSPAAEEGMPGPRPGLWCFLPVRAVTESAESQSKTTFHPESLEGHLNWVSSYFGTLASGCLGLRGLSIG